MVHDMIGDTTVCTFSLYGTQVRVTMASALLADPVIELLKHFRSERSEHDEAVSLSLHAVADRTEVPLILSPTASRLSSGTGEGINGRPATGLSYDVWKDGDRLLADFHRAGALLMEPRRGQADIYLVSPESMHANLIEYLFHLALIELLRVRGLYTIHATALERHGRGVLIPGNSGRGKTTSFVSLLRSGYRYLSDDHPLIQDVGSHVDVLPFPIKINVTDATVSFFPELQNAPAGVLRPGLGKRSFDAEAIYSASIGERCRPTIVLFPNVVDSPRSDLELLPKSRALEALLPQALLVYDREVARREFQVLAKLVQQVDCYRLHFGRNILDLPALISPLLDQAR